MSRRPARAALAAGAAWVALAAPPAGAEALGPAAAVAAVARVEDPGPAVPGLGARLAEIRRRIAAALRYPPIARLRDVTGEARVRFEIGPSRHARNVAVVASSGVPSLDRAAARAVRDAGELPYVHGTLEVPVRFDLAREP